MKIRIVAKKYSPAKQAELYFGIDETNLARPFVLGAQSVDQSLPAIATWGAASTFGLDNLDTIDGTEWRDWRRSLVDLGCAWVVPIIETARSTGDLSGAVSEILRRHSQERACERA